MKYKATPQLMELAQKAMDLQNACNPCGLSLFLHEVYCHFNEADNGQDQSGTDMAANNPVSAIIVNKLEDLRGAICSCFAAFDVCHRLIAGEDVEFGRDI